MSTVVYTSNFVLEQMSATHDFGADTLKMALFPSAAALSQGTATYSSTNELATGGGYTAGGATISITATYPKIEDGRAATRIETVNWTLTTPKTIRYALIYNSSKSNKAIAVFDFGQDRTYFGAFSLTFPLTQPALFIATAPTA